MSAALEILLGGPSYHGGAHLVDGPLQQMQKWLRCHRISYNARQDRREVTPSERSQVMTVLAEQYAGFASVTDTPAFYYAEELCELYPDAAVIVTTRDVDAWWASKLEVNGLMRDWLWLKKLMLWPIPGSVRYWPTFGRLMLGGAYGEHLGSPRREVYERHITYLKRVVPARRLYFFELEQGWAPLCAILGKDVPDVPFPRLNEREAFRATMWRKLRLGMLCWAILLSAGAVGARLACMLL